MYDPQGITFSLCLEWEQTPYGCLLRDMRVMILGIDGYLVCYVSGVNNYNRRHWVGERGAHTVVHIASMTDCIHTASEVLGVNNNFRRIDICNGRNQLKEFIEEEKPETIVHHAENPSAPFSIDRRGACRSSAAE